MSSCGCATRIQTAIRLSADLQFATATVLMMQQEKDLTLSVGYRRSIILTTAGTGVSAYEQP